MFEKFSSTVESGFIVEQASFGLGDQSSRIGRSTLSCIILHEMYVVVLVVIHSRMTTKLCSEEAFCLCHRAANCSTSLNYGSNGKVKMLALTSLHDLICFHCSQAQVQRGWQKDHSPVEPKMRRVVHRPGQSTAACSF